MVGPVRCRRCLPVVSLRKTEKEGDCWILVYILCLFVLVIILSFGCFPFFFLFVLYQAQFCYFRCFCHSRQHTLPIHRPPNPNQLPHAKKTSNARDGQRRGTEHRQPQPNPPPTLPTTNTRSCNDQNKCTVSEKRARRKIELQRREYRCDLQQFWVEVRVTAVEKSLLPCIDFLVYAGVCDTAAAAKNKIPVLSLPFPPGLAYLSLIAEQLHENG